MKNTVEYIQQSKKRLYQLPQGSPLRVETRTGKENATFHRLDGAFSLCSLDGYETPNIFHLHAHTPLVFVDDRWEIDLEGETYAGE